MDFCEAVQRSRDGADLRTFIDAFAAAHSATVGCVMAQRGTRRGEWRVSLIGNLPEAVASTMLTQEARQNDPVWAHCERTSLPLIWNQATYQTADQGLTFESLRLGGVQSGIATPIASDKRLFVLRLDSPLPQPAPADELARLVARVRLLATYAEAAALRLELFPAADTPPIKPPSLTLRELEVLHWAAQGKTEWETGKILSLSQHTVSEHLESAAKRLNCATKIQAVVRAYRAGLL